MTEAAISLDAQDVLECLSSSSNPLTLASIRLNVPWVGSLHAPLQELVATGLVDQFRLQFPHANLPNEADQELQVEELLLYRSARCRSAAPSNDRADLRSVLESLQAAVAEHGVSAIPAGLLPPTTRSSLAEELQKLRDIRTQYIERLKELEGALGTRSYDENELRNSTRFEASASSSELARMEEHRNNKIKVRLDAKELLQALAGLMAEHNNVTIPDVIKEYMQMQ